MNNAERGTGCGEKGHERCPRCDPDLLDELKCKAAGIQAQAEYNAAHGQELDDARAAFMAARAAYSDARSAAKPLVADARRKLEDLLDRVRCQLDGEDVECIDTAFGRVVELLNRCGHARCCCDEDCDYDDEVRDCDPDDVPGRLAVIEHRTKEATECFWSLIGEHTVVPAPTPAPSPPAPAPAPTAATPAPAAAPAPAAGAAAAAPAPATPADTPLAALPARVKELQDDIEAISKATADGSWEPAKLYAAVLVTRRHLKDIWLGFANVNEYMECLCRALTCMIKGHAAIGELTRQDAVNHCRRESWKAACEYLKQHTVEEVLAEYLRVCAEAGDDDEDDDDHGDDDHADDDHADDDHADDDHADDDHADDDHADDDHADDDHGDDDKDNRREGRERERRERERRERERRERERRERERREREGREREGRERERRERERREREGRERERREREDRERERREREGRERAGQPRTAGGRFERRRSRDDA